MCIRWLATRAFCLAAAVFCLLPSAFASPPKAVKLKQLVASPADGYDDTDGFWVPFEGDAVFWAKGNLGIWRSDGTPAGTANIQPYVGVLSKPFQGADAISTDNVVFFIANDGFYGSELWRTDGTSGGALRMSDVVVGSGSPSWDYWNATDGQMYISIMEKYYTSDGTTPASFSLFLDGGPGGGFPYPDVLDVQGKLYFMCSMGSGGGLCVHDATGTTLLVDIGVTSARVAVNEKVFFTATNAAAGNELWVTSGTVASTHMVADLVSGVASSNPSSLTRVDDRLFFIARDTAHGYELWASDGTAAGTTMVTDLNSGSGQGATGPLVPVDGTLYFFGYDAIAGTELFKSGGTAATTSLVKDTIPGSGSNTAAGMLAVNGKLVASMKNTASPFVNSLWVSDGTDTGTVGLDPNAGTGYKFNVVRANGHLVFPATLSGSPGVEPVAIDLERVTGHKWCSYPERTIPDFANSTAGTLTDSMKIPEWGGVEDLSVSVDIGHTYVNDLSVQLIAPDGTTQYLVNRPKVSGGSACSGDLLNVNLVSAGVVPPVDTNCANSRPAYPMRASYLSSGSLGVFDGKLTKGTWKLKVSDNAAADVGTLHQWCVDFKTDRIFDYGFDD